MGRRVKAEARNVSLFTNGKDNKFVPNIYRLAFEHIKNAKDRFYMQIGWGDAEVIKFSDFMRTSQTGFLSFYNNQMTDASMHVLCDACVTAGTVHTLLLYKNVISERSTNDITALISGLPALVKLGLAENPLCHNHDAVAAIKAAWLNSGKDERGLFVGLVTP